jgi:hypothetical protein
MKRTPFIFCSFDTDRSVKMQKYLPTEDIFLCDGLHPNLSFRVHWNEEVVAGEPVKAVSCYPGTAGPR